MTGRPRQSACGFTLLEVVVGLMLVSAAETARRNSFAFAIADVSAPMEAAIAEGATWVRIGTALFGARDYGQPSHQ